VTFVGHNSAGKVATKKIRFDDVSRGYSSNLFPKLSQQRHFKLSRLTMEAPDFTRFAKGLAMAAEEGRKAAQFPFFDHGAAILEAINSVKTQIQELDRKVERMIERLDRMIERLEQTAQALDQKVDGGSDDGKPGAKGTSMGGKV